jgi:type I restriction enzyme S subunit
MRVLPDTAKIQPGYLYAYLSSKFGIPLVVSGTYGAIIQHIEPEHLATLPVPRLGTAIESRITRRIDQASELLTAYQRQIVEATGKFFSAVALRDISAAEWHELGRDLGFEQTFPFEPSFRPVNFSPRFKLLCDRVRSTCWKPLGDLCVPDTLKRGGRYRRVDADPEFGYELIGQKELFHLRPEGRWIARKSVGEDVFLSEGTIAVAAQGTLGESQLYCRAEFIWGPWTRFAYSEHMLRVVADKSKILPGCLFAFLRSETAFRMLRSISSGGKLQDNHYYFLPRLPIPVPDKKQQQAIHDMVVEAYEMRHRAVALEDEAIHEVERAIERAVG